jgi:predicted lipid-binding transport protein (Tim44 family)
VISEAEPTQALPTTTTSHAVIPTPAKSSSASPSSSATPSPSAPAGPLSGLVGGLPLVGGFVGGPLAGLGLRR